MQGFRVLATISKLAAIAATFLALAFGMSIQEYQVLIAFTVCIGALVVVHQALSSARYSWAVVFFLIAVIFNPAALFLTFSGAGSLLVISATAALFAVSSAAIRTRTLFSIPSITDRTPGSESL